ncbi:MAG: SDR family NAD(P)-dependent oxidoreductase, partial [bacterium]|nr:SDR family NAD(P)-dependent oxidoreductase [bacterium]
MGIEGLRFVITGSATGIGAATARVAAGKGAKVMVCDLNDEQGQAVADEINASGGTAAYQHCDVTDTGQVEALMAATAEAFGGIDVLHNNAGIHESGLAAADQCNLEQMPLDVFKKVVEVNAVAPWICSKAALPYLKESDWPSIVNAAST